jgi:sugar/nucleoside kinase (ribokinase family)
MGAQYDVIGIGNAIVDVLSHADDSFLAENRIEKGAMTLIDTARAEELYARMGPGIEVSGGSAANTMAGIASLGGRAAYVGKVCEDQLGAVFRHDIRSAGVHYTTPAATEGAPTARCLILVTPDAQRSMNTYLGASVELGPEDVDEAEIRAAAVTYLEGYLWDPPRAKEAFRKAAAIAHESGRKVSLSLSDAFCVHRHRVEFLALYNDHIDLLFANEAECLALFEVGSFEQALAALRGHGGVTVVTRGALGAAVISGGEVCTVPAEPVAHVVDTTGAGDLFAAGFLHGYTQGRPLAECARIGAIAAAEIIGHLGARPDESLAGLVRARLG